MIIRAIATTSVLNAAGVCITINGLYGFLSHVLACSESMMPFGNFLYTFRQGRLTHRHGRTQDGQTAGEDKIGAGEALKGLNVPAHELPARL
jgi:hypothetical protein